MADETGGSRGPASKRPALRPFSGGGSKRPHPVLSRPLTAHAGHLGVEPPVETPIQTSAGVQDVGGHVSGAHEVATGAQSDSSPKRSAVTRDAAPSALDTTALRESLAWPSARGAEADPSISYDDPGVEPRGVAGAGSPETDPPTRIDDRASWPEDGVDGVEQSADYLPWQSAAGSRDEDVGVTSAYISDSDPNASVEPTGPCDEFDAIADAGQEVQDISQYTVDEAAWGGNANFTDGPAAPTPASDDAYAEPNGMKTPHSGVPMPELRRSDDLITETPNDELPVDPPLAELDERDDAREDERIFGEAPRRAFTRWNDPSQDQESTWDVAVEFEAAGPEIEAVSDVDVSCVNATCADVAHPLDDTDFGPDAGQVAELTPPPEASQQVDPVMHALRPTTFHVDDAAYTFAETEQVEPVANAWWGVGEGDGSFVNDAASEEIDEDVPRIASAARDDAQLQFDGDAGRTDIATDVWSDTSDTAGQRESARGEDLDAALRNFELQPTERVARVRPLPGASFELTDAPTPAAPRPAEDLLSVDPAPSPAPEGADDFRSREAQAPERLTTGQTGEPSAGEPRESVASAHGLAAPFTQAMGADEVLGTRPRSAVSEVIDFEMPSHVVETLEMVARRVRAGEIVVAADASASAEAVLASVLASLLAGRT